MLMNINLLVLFSFESKKCTLHSAWYMYGDLINERQQKSNNDDNNDNNNNNNNNNNNKTGVRGVAKVQSISPLQLLVVPSGIID